MERLIGSNATIVALHFMGEGYLSELAKHEPTLTRSERDVVEWLVRGKFPVSADLWETSWCSLSRVGLES
ncbi:MAG: hypothetical protein HY673_00065 [Chloroflexi bacterium]|nr:hypothetical protein [Chloroflexota bacterium]